MPDPPNNAAADSTRISPRNRLGGELRLPGDKSISHRAAMSASLANGRSVLKNFSSAEDCAATLRCLQALGVSLTKEGSSVVVEGVGSEGFREPDVSLDAGNSGTTMRLLAGILAGQNFTSTLTGDESLLRRPMLRVAEPLRLMGARVELKSQGCAPLRIEGRRPLRAISYHLPNASAQIKSSILFAGLAAEGVTTIEEPEATRDHSERMLPAFGVSLEKIGNTVSIKGGQKLTCCNLEIPGDISSAAFFIALAAALPDSELLIRDVGLNPTRTAFIEALVSVGADIKFTERRFANGEPVGSLRIRGKSINKPRKLQISGALVSPLIDELPLLAVFAASIGGEMSLRGATELRFKESDRIRATVDNLGRMGAPIVERENGWKLQSGARIHGSDLSSFGDHRIAMSCAVAALLASSPSRLEGAREVVNVSLPEFWTLLDSLTE